MSYQFEELRINIPTAAQVAFNDFQVAVTNSVKPNVS